MICMFHISVQMYALLLDSFAITKHSMMHPVILCHWVIDDKRLRLLWGVESCQAYGEVYFFSDYIISF